MMDSSAPEPTKEPGALRLTCHTCKFRWESPNTSRGTNYIENTRAAHAQFFTGHELTTGQADRLHAGGGAYASMMDEG